MTQASNRTNNNIQNLNYDIFITIEKFSMSESTINCTVRIRRGNQEGCSSDHTTGHAICGQGLLTSLQSFFGSLEVLVFVLLFLRRHWRLMSRT
ncbi:hypothetical protein BDN70DRAFT_662781 [Pholiota conissans]|uniref:Uncharacterized protein n=1 Tax=Pholiota conissans TaxID=109636 RepID=A0A9P5YN86_9AGAR|nr:hypothetical protein BDN70DRAFT_662781 [Pholiota conissans]